MLLARTRAPARLLCIVLAIGSMAGCAVRREPAARVERENGPSAWFMNQRRSVDGTIPDRSRAHALESSRALAGALDAPGTWISIGPNNIGGRVTALAVDPTNASRVWAGSAAGGVFVSADAGNTWAPIFDSQTALSIGSLAAHPSQANTLYVGTGEDNGGGFSYDGEGVFRTTDGGASWTNLGLGEVRRIGRIAIDPTNPSKIFVAGGGDWFAKDENRGIYRSLDGGATWTKVLYVGDDAGGIDLVIDPTNPSIVFAAIWQRFSGGATWYIGGAGSGIYRSLDGGTTWTELTSGLPAQSGRIGIAMAPTNHLTLYAVVIDVNGSLDGIYRTLDGGNTWVKRSAASLAGSFSTYSYYFGQIRVSPLSENTVYALDLALLRSTNGGSSFSTIGSSVHGDWHALIVEPGGRFLAGTDGGFYRSTNSGSNWTKSASFPITQLYDLGISKQNPLVRFSGAQDTGMLRTTTGGTSDWSDRLGGDGLQCEVDPATPARVYAETQFGDIYRSTNTGNTFTYAVTGIDLGDRKNWSTPITIDPQAPATLYTGTYRLYRSTDAAVSWNQISGDLTHGHPGEPLVEPIVEDAEGPPKSHLMNLIDGTITVVSVSPVDGNVLWVGTDDGRVWVTRNGSSTWSVANPPGPEYWVTDIEPSPFDAGAAYLTVTGYRTGDSLPYVRSTRDYGATWQDLSGGLPQVPVNTILPSSQWHGRLFAGTDLGVYLSDDDGVTWSAMRTGMPHVVVMDLEEHTASHTVYAATHGRSIYTYDLAQLATPDGDGDGFDNNADCALADPGAYAFPGVVGTLQVDRAAGASGTSLDVVLSWSNLAVQAGPGTSYDVVAATLASLRVQGTAGASGLGCATSGTSFADSSPLNSANGLYYLVRARNGCGLGGWGTDSAGSPRSVSACP